MHRQDSRHADPLRAGAGSAPPKSRDEINPVARLCLAGVSMFAISTQMTVFRQPVLRLHCSPQTRIFNALLYIDFSHHAAADRDGTGDASNQAPPLTNECVMKLQFGAARTGRGGAECCSLRNGLNQAQGRSAQRRPARRRDSGSLPSVHSASLFRPCDKLVTPCHDTGTF